MILIGCTFFQLISYISMRETFFSVGENTLFYVH